MYEVPRITSLTEQTSNYASTAMGATCDAADAVPLPKTSLPSQKVGSSFPGTKSRSTPSSVMTAIRMTPPEEPSRDIASERASQG